VGVDDVGGVHARAIVGRDRFPRGNNGVHRSSDVTDTAQLAEYVSDYLDQLGHRVAAVDELRQAAVELGPPGSAEVLRGLDAVDEAVRRSDESARVLLRWLRAGSN